MFIIYLTENQINGKKYIGKHKGEITDYYFGSGILISLAIKKYGIECFKKTLLYKCETVENANLAEKKFIEVYNAVNDKNFYNLTDGGDGGNTLKNLSDEKLKNRSDKIKKTLKKMYNENKNYFSNIKSKNMKQIRQNKKMEEKRLKTLKQTISKYTNQRKKQIYKSRSGKNNYGNRIVKTPDGIFYTAKNAAIFYNVHTQTILNRCKNSTFKFKKWKFLDEKY